MGKVLAAILGVAALAGAAHFALKPTENEPEAHAHGEPSEPARQLDNVRGAAQRLENEQQQRLDGMLDSSN